jgi:adenosine deaminase
MSKAYPNESGADVSYPQARDLRALPKAHLHIHLDGAMRRSTLAEFAATAGIEAPLPSSYGSFADFTDTITAAARSLRKPADATRLITEIVQDAEAAGAVWIEPSMWPGLFGGRLGSDEDAVDIVLAAGHEAAQASGFGLIVAANRNAGPDAAVKTARLAVSRMAEGVVGFGLDGDEATAPGAEFTAAFDLAHDAGLACVPHAGELAGADSVRDAMTLLHADRIMHGVRAIESPETLAKLADSAVPLDICPTSNVLLSVVPTLAEHPLPALLSAGVRCSVHTDDPLLFDTDLLTEYEQCRAEMGLSDETLAGLARASVGASGAPAGRKEDALAGIDHWLKNQV